MKQITLAVLAILLFGSAAAGAACEVKPEPPPNMYYLLFDQSLSPESGDQPQWRKIGEQIVDGLGGGDGIEILGIHDQSNNASPILPLEVLKVLPKYTTSEEEQEIRAQWAEIRQKAKAAIATALNPPKRANWTDIIGAINRIHHSENQVAQIVIFSDMKESTKALDLENVKLTEKNLGPSLNATIARFTWEKDQLSGAKVHCILDRVSLGGGKPSVNARPMLRRFWEIFFRSFKAELVTFETHLSPNQFGGSRDAAE